MCCLFTYYAPDGPVGNRCSGSGQPPKSFAPVVDSLFLLNNNSNNNISNNNINNNTPSDVSESDTGFAVLPHVKLLKRIPRSSRELAARKLASILVCLTLPRDVYECPKEVASVCSLAAQVNRQLSEESDPPSQISSHSKTNVQQRNEVIHAAKVTAKLEEGDFRGAVRLCCSDDTLAVLNEATVAILRSKHPPAHPDSISVSFDYTIVNTLMVCEENVLNAILRIQLVVWMVSDLNI